MNTPSLMEITRVAITTDGTNAVAAYYAGDALMRVISLDPAARSDAAIITDACVNLPAPHHAASIAEFVITRDPGDGAAISLTTTNTNTNTNTNTR